MIRLLEELSFNAWPALQTIHYDGWLVRLADGFSRRANSVSPIYHSTLPIDEKISHCEQVYRKRGLDTVFKMTSSVRPEYLDEILDRRGYEHQGMTVVKLMDLRHFSPALSKDSSTLSIVQSDYPTREWLDANWGLHEIKGSSTVQAPRADADAVRRGNMAHILESVAPDQIFLSLTDGSHTVAAGRAVREGEFLGLYDVVVAAGLRGQGLGAQMVNALLDWGRQNGAKQAYLQVMHGNIAAHSLYAKFGFAELYQYWYRVKP